MKKLRYLLEAVLLSTLFIISKLLPAQWASNLGGWVGRSIGPRLAASRKALQNLENALPDLSLSERQEAVRGMWDNLGRVMMEYPHLEHIGRDRTEIIGGEILEQYKDSAAVLFTAHLANWEICPVASLTQTGFKVTSVYRAPNNPISDKMLSKARSLNGRLDTIPKSKTGTRHLVKALQAKEHIGILIDQKYNQGIAADFFGQSAMTSPAYIQLAQKFDCPLIPLKIERLKGANFRLTILPPLEIIDKTVEAVMDESHALLEGWIKDNPSQWLWLHRRWVGNQVKEG